MIKLFLYLRSFGYFLPLHQIYLFLIYFFYFFIRPCVFRSLSLWNSIDIFFFVFKKKNLVVAGTLRPDLIESASSLASGKADAIKTHHNDTDLVRELRELVRNEKPLF